MKKIVAAVQFGEKFKHEIRKQIWNSNPNALDERISVGADYKIGIYREKKRWCWLKLTVTVIFCDWTSADHGLKSLIEESYKKDIFPEEPNFLLSYLHFKRINKSTGAPEIKFGVVSKGKDFRKWVSLLAVGKSKFSEEMGIGVPSPAASVEVDNPPKPTNGHRGLVPMRCLVGNEQKQLQVSPHLKARMEKVWVRGTSIETRREVEEVVNQIERETGTRIDFPGDHPNGTREFVH